MALCSFLNYWADSTGDKLHHGERTSLGCGKSRKSCCLTSDLGLLRTASPLKLFVSGGKARTSEMVALIQERRASLPLLPPLTHTSFPRQISRSAQEFQTLHRFLWGFTWTQDFEMTKCCHVLSV